MFHFLCFALLAGLLCFGMLVFLEIGRRHGQRLAAETEGENPAAGFLVSSVFTLLGLLIAFAFSGALDRFDARRQLMVDEANDIGTAYLRIDLLPADAQPAMRQMFRDYTEGRIAVYEKLPDVAAAQRELVRVQAMHAKIWTEAVAAARRADTPAANMLFLPALNSMFDILATQTMATRAHPPVIIFIVLFLIALLSALLSGYGLARAKSRYRIQVLAYAFSVAIAVYVILDLEYPRLGFIRIDNFDQALIDTAASMK